MTWYHGRHSLLISIEAMHLVIISRAAPMLPLPRLRAENHLYVVNFFIFTLLVQTVFYIVSGIQVLMPRRAEEILDTLFNWLKSPLRAIAIGIFVGFGLFFIIKGLIGLAD